MQEIEELEVAKVKCLRSSLFFTRYFFKHQYNRKFVIGEHHQLITEKLDAVFRGEITRLIINIAPRYGKTELAVKSFIANGLALNPSAKFIHLSYSQDLALDNSETVKDLVQSEGYQQMFPGVQIKKDSRSKDKWYTTAGGGVLARAAAGQVTGFGAGKVDEEEEEEEDQEEKDFEEFISEVEARQGFAGAVVIDDPIKPDDADSATIRERVNARFDSTIVNRVNSRNTPIIVIMQRLHEHDLCGHLLENYPGEWEVLSMPCIIKEPEQKLQEGRALWPFKHTLEELLKMQRVNPVNFSRQQMQDPQPREGFLYSPFKTYKELPIAANAVRKSYTDTADTGSDYLCSIAYDQLPEGCYVVNDPLAVIYTQDNMDATEPMTAKQLTMLQVRESKVESNNGGRGFARAVERSIRLLGNSKTKVNWFHQSANKHARILNNQADVNNLIYFPENWQYMWPEFYKHVTTYLSEVHKNTHDDAPDTLTGMAEEFTKPKAGFGYRKATR